MSCLHHVRIETTYDLSSRLDHLNSDDIINGRWSQRWGSLLSSLLCSLFKAKSISTIQRMVSTSNSSIVFVFNLSTIVVVRKMLSISLEPMTISPASTITESCIVSANCERETSPSVPCCINGDLVSTASKNMHGIGKIPMHLMNTFVSVFITDHLERTANINYPTVQHSKRRSSGNLSWDRIIQKQSICMVMWSVMRHWNVSRVCCVSIGERSVMEFKIVSKEKMKRIVISGKWIDVTKKKNIDVWMECVFHKSSFSMVIVIVSIGRMRCYSRVITTAPQRVWVANVMIIFVHLTNGHVEMDSVSKIDWCFKDCQSTSHVTVDVISISCVKPIWTRSSGQWRTDDVSEMTDMNQWHWRIAVTGNNANISSNVFSQEDCRGVVLVTTILGVPKNWLVVVLSYGSVILLKPWWRHSFTFSSIEYEIGQPM